MLSWLPAWSKTLLSTAVIFSQLCCAHPERRRHRSSFSWQQKRLYGDFSPHRRVHHEGVRVPAIFGTIMIPYTLLIHNIHVYAKITPSTPLITFRLWPEFRPQLSAHRERSNGLHQALVTSSASYYATSYPFHRFIRVCVSFGRLRQPRYDTVVTVTFRLPRLPSQALKDQRNGIHVSAILVAIPNTYSER